MEGTACRFAQCQVVMMHRVEGDRLQLLNIYFAFFDDGTFIMTLQKMLEESMKIAGTDELLIQQIEQTKNIIEKTTTNDFVWQMMNNNLLNTTILPMIIAIFVKRKDK